MSSMPATGRAIVLVPVVILSLMLGFACAPDKSAPAVHTLGELRGALDARTRTVTVGDEEGPEIVLAPELSARVMAASFHGGEGENLLWVTDAVYNGAYFQTRPYPWNAGGYRTWLAPGSLFFSDSLGARFVPAQLDPAPYRTVDETPYGATFEADVNLKTSTEAYYRLIIRRRIGLIDEPPADVRSFTDGIDYVGIDFMHSLTNRAEEVIGVDIPAICLRNMFQVESPVTVLVPLVAGADPGSACRTADDGPDAGIEIQNGIVSILLDGEHPSQVGIRPEAAGKGIACLRDTGNGRGILYVMLFPVDPTGLYVEGPDGNARDDGDAIALLSGDDGYAEIGCYGPARTIARGETQSHTATLHIFRGPEDRLREIGTLLLGANLAGAHYF